MTDLKEEQARSGWINELEPNRKAADFANEKPVSVGFQSQCRGKFQTLVCYTFHVCYPFKEFTSSTFEVL